MAKEKAKVLSMEQLKKQINKEYGNIAKTREDIPQKVEVHCSSGSFSLDLIMGCGGIPKGRMICLQGKPSGGKTLFSLIMASEMQKKGKSVCFIDLEGTYTHDWAEKLGMSLDNLLYVRPERGGEALEVLKTMIINNVDFIIVDSISALMTEREEGADMDKDLMAELARLLGKSLKKLTASMAGKTSTVAFINQVRANITSMGAFGVKGTGGNALEHYSSMVLDINREEIIGDDDNPQGFITKIKVKKNKCGIPFRTAQISLYIGPEKYGVDKDSEVIDIAIQLKEVKRLIKKVEKKKGKNVPVLDENGNEIFVENSRGTYYQYGDNRFYGRPKMLTYFEENKEEFETVKKNIEDIMKEKDKVAEDSFAAKTQGK